MVLNSLLLMKREVNTVASIFEIVCIVVIAFLVAVAIVMVMKLNFRGLQFIKKNFLAVLMANICMLLVIALSISAYQNYVKDDSKGSYKFTSLTEIKDAITVENDKVKIDKLSKDYKYVSDYQELDRNETQIFKLEENKFYEKRWLVDQYGRRFQLDSEEYKMLNDKRQK